MARHPEDLYGSEGSVPNQQSLQGSGAGPMSVRATPEDMGTAVGQGVSKVGDTAEALALHFSQIYADSTARDRTTQQSMQLGQAEEEYKKLKGNDAVAGLAAFQQKAQQIATNGSQGLSMAANQQYQGEFARYVDGAIFRAGGYAGNQAQEAHINSLNGTTANNINQFSMNATNPTGEGFFKTVIGNSYDTAHALGHTPEAADALASHNGGEAVAAAIKANISSDPDGAKVIYDKYINMTIPLQRPDADGKMAEVQVPVVDSAHRAQISSEMGGEFRRQENEQLFTARSYASLGILPDEKSLRAAMTNAGRSADYQDAQIAKLNQLVVHGNAADSKYKLDKSIDNATTQASAGIPITENITPEQIAAAYPNNLEKQKDILAQVNDLHTVAAFRGSLPSTPLSKISDTADSYKPPVIQNASLDPLSTIRKNEGYTGKVGKDNNGYEVFNGINGQFFPKELAEAKDILTKQGKPAADKYADDFYQKNILDKYDIKSLPANTQAIVADGLVNHGTSDFGQSLIKAARDGKTPQELIDMRRAEYQRVAQLPGKDGNHPYAASLPGWNNRLDNLQNQGDNFADQTRLSTAIQNAKTAFFKQVKEDPAGTYTNSSPILQGLLADAIKDPTKMNLYIDASLKQQESMEVPKEFQAALPVNIASNIADNIMKNPAGPPAMINDLAKKTGAAWPQIYKSLVAQGSLPAYYQSVAQLGSDPKTERDASLLAQWRGEDVKGKTESDLVGPKVYADTRTKVESDPNVQNLLFSLRRGGSSLTQVEDMLHSIQSLALAKTYNKDSNPVQGAIDSFTSNYEYMPNGGARVPADKFDAVTTNAMVTLNNIEKNAVAPDFAKTGFHGLPNETAYYEAVKASPSWITHNNQIQLLDPWGGYVKGKDGKPISVSFDALAPEQDFSKPVPIMIPGP